MSPQEILTPRHFQQLSEFTFLILIEVLTVWINFIFMLGVIHDIVI